MKVKLAIAALLATTAASAQAGIRAEIQAGWDNFSAEQRTDVGTSGATDVQKADGVIFGGEIGYDLELSRFNLGVYAGIQGASTEKCSEVFAEVETCASAGRNWTLGARAGFKATDTVLVYAKGGYSNGSIKLDLIDHATPANSLSTSEEMGGFHVGAGVQVGLFDKVYAKLEYVHSDYEDYAFEEGNATISGGLKRDNVIFGVGLAF